MDENNATTEKLENLQREFLNKLHNTELFNLKLIKNEKIINGNLTLDSNDYFEAIEIKLYKYKQLQRKVLLYLDYKDQIKINVFNCKDLIDVNKYKREIDELYNHLRTKIINADEETMINQLTNLLEYF